MTQQSIRAKSTPASVNNKMQKPEVQYKGRKTSRAGSENRRLLILEAALRIVVREGVRGVRHRAVAKEADVPLAATTYYFKDIQELINDTFTLYAEKALKVVNQFAVRLSDPSKNDNKESFAQLLANADNMVELIADYMTQYVTAQITEHRDALVAEQAFRYEAILNPHLRALGSAHKEALMQKLIEILLMVKSPNPEADANIVISILHRIEYEGLLVEPEAIDTAGIRDTFVRQLNLMFKS